MSDQPKYKPVPIIAPAISAMLVLAILFWFGLSEQKHLIKSSTEEVVARHESLARIVAGDIEKELQQAKSSIDRYSLQLAQGLDITPKDYLHRFDKLFSPLDDGSIRSRKQQFNGTSESGVWSMDSKLPFSQQANEADVC